MNRTNTPPSPKYKLTQKYLTSRMNLLAVIIFTLLNVVFLVTGSDMYFLFTAAIPYHLVVFGMLLTGKFPPEMYEGETFEFLDSSFLVATVVIAAVILLFYLLFFFLSKKHYGFLIAALVFFSFDCAYFLYLLIGSEFDFSLIIDIAFHAWVMYYLISGVIAGRKLKTIADAPFTDSNSFGTAEQADAPVSGGSDDFDLSDGFDQDGTDPKDDSTDENR